MTDLVEVTVRVITAAVFALIASVALNEWYYRDWEFAKRDRARARRFLVAVVGWITLKPWRR